MKQKILRNLSSVPGASIDRKIVVIESDDWGSLRMPSKEVYAFLDNNKLDVSSGDSKRYNENDTLESAEDLNALYDVLTSVKDAKGNYPIFSPITIVANPDFEKIKANHFEHYYYEPFNATLNRYNRTQAFALWKEGIDNKLFLPEFHGREHLNVATWMRALQNKDAETHLAFDKEVWGYTNKNKFNVMYQAAFDLEFKEDLQVQKEVITSGLDLFESLFGYKARYFVPPNGNINNALEQVASEKGIDYIFAAKIQKEALGQGNVKNRFYWLGKKNAFGQMYTTRNCFFEPSQEGKDWLNTCLSDIEIAFRWKKPAVISTHRVNFIGGLRPENRTKGLAAFKQLLDTIVKKWPDVEFMSSAAVADSIAGKNRGTAKQL
ncbi:polysaccharide (de)acetylase [Flavobacterium paronense]|uniref:polysaccharide (de)acetylase n=1 Tax=Flavobacterium paronense TaxID=1392775 RepID=UPI0025B4E774|nr:polysaccharide (de)acetylase [Flavobacterium paronense]MDN3676675.1 polysaccharide (de)acetylase [Flavobacterium paronense]